MFGGKTRIDVSKLLTRERKPKRTGGFLEFVFDARPKSDRGFAKSRRTTARLEETGRDGQGGKILGPGQRSAGYLREVLSRALVSNPAE
jgi:hypothetical protein